MSTLNPHGGVAQRKNARRLAQREMEKAVIGSVRPKIAAALQASGSVRPLLTLSELEKALPQVRTPADRRRQLVTLESLLRNGVDSGVWSVDRFPDPIVRIRRRSSPFRPDRMALAHTVAKVRAAHLENLGMYLGKISKDKEALALQTRLRAAQIVVSSVTLGGLLSKSFVEDLPTRMGTHLFEHEGLVWIDFDCTSEDQANSGPLACRRWFPDPVTVALILRWRLDGLVWPRGDGVSSDSLLRSYLAKLKKGPRVVASRIGSDEFEHGPPLTLHKLIQGARTHLGIHLPQLLIGFASDPKAGRSLDAASWVRSLSGRRLVTPMEETEIQSQGEEDDLPGPGPDDPSDFSTKKQSAKTPQHRLLTVLTSGLRGRKSQLVNRASAKRHIESFISQFGTALSPVLLYLAQWALWSLTYRTKGKGSLKPSSVARYLSAIGPALITHGLDLSEDDLSGANDDCQRLTAAFDTVVETKKGPDQAYACDRLVEFQYFLSFKLDGPPMAWRHSSGVSSVPRGSIITEAEYGALIQSIGASSLPSREKELLHLITTFGFRLGLRRDEICSRQLNCAQGLMWAERGESIRPQLWIHATSAGGIKRRSSNRRIPLYHLLTKHELDLLRKWIKRRRNEIGPNARGTELLFTASASLNEKLRDSDGFSQITALVHEVTGDPDLQFHSLRHSFTTLLVARLLSAAINGQWIRGAPPVHLPKSWHCEDARLSGAKLIKALLLLDRAPRQTMYMVSALLGHIDPAEATDTYCHCLDLLLYLHLSRIDHSVSHSTRQRVLGKSDSAPRVAALRARRRGIIADESDGRPESVRSVMHDLIAAARRAGVFATLLATTDLVIRPAALSQSSAPRAGFPKIDDVYWLVLSTNTKLSSAARAERVGLTPDFVDAILCAAKHYSRDVTTDARGSTRRSRAVRRKTTTRVRTPLNRVRPEIVGVGRALPKVSAELQQATTFYEKIVENGMLNPHIIDAAVRIFSTMSRTRSFIELSSEQEAKALVAILKTTGTATSRLQIRIVSAPVNAQSPSMLKSVREALNVTRKQISVDDKLRRREKGETFGRLEVRLMPAGSRTGKAMFGWTVGLFYALVVLRAMSKRMRRAHSFS